MNQKTIEGIEGQIIQESIPEFQDQQIEPLQFQSIEKNKILKYQINNISNQYILINSIKNDQTCYSIALNQDDTLLLASADSLIKIYQFKKGEIKYIQQVAIHQKDVNILKFSKQYNSDSFISASDDLSIKLTSSFTMSNPKVYQKLTGHSYSISGLLYNQKGDLIVSSSYDNTIKFWSNNSKTKFGWICTQTIYDHKNSIYSISFNELENEIISCGEDNLLLVLYQYDLIWRVKQQIRLNFFGIRLCFIDMNTFIFLSYSSSYLEVYQRIDSRSQYLKITNFAIAGVDQPCQTYYPSSFNIPKQLLFIKNGYNLNILKYNHESSSQFQFQLTQVIEFNFGFNEIFGEVEHGDIYGVVSENGDFLFTWDAKSRQIQIRKYQKKL
ncbi:unnamed protein product [Paramecium sonneborni]|uniref:WD40-repeat-containing domain n=1 Tax=Paramecium sonneborni TaxID=65129 RepID=A0A8S1R0K7_9CILI|nr:unnamed protein product [Paramecium sonneborni]